MGTTRTPEVERLAARIQELMLEQDTNAAELGRRAGLNYTGVSDILTGKIKAPTIVTVTKIARALNTSVADLLANESSPKSESAIVSIFNQLTDEDKKRLIAIAKSLQDT